MKYLFLSFFCFFSFNSTACVFAFDQNYTSTDVGGGVCEVEVVATWFNINAESAQIYYIDESSNVVTMPFGANSNFVVFNFDEMCGDTINVITEFYSGGNTCASYSLEVIIVDGNTSLPVELLDFWVEDNDKEIELKWTTASELNNSHFEIEQSSNGREWATVSIVQGFGTTTEKKQYSSSLKKSQLYKFENYFRLKQIDLNGMFKYVGKIIHYKIGENTFFASFNNDKITSTEECLLYDLTGKQILQVKQGETFINVPFGIYLIANQENSRLICIN